eukprot:6211897-Pleurochrysis_carterae.AAC.2
MSSPIATVLVRVARGARRQWRILALIYAVILFEHGEDLEAHLVKIVAPLALEDLEPGLQWCADPSSSELMSSRSFSTMVHTAASVPEVMPCAPQPGPCARRKLW